MIEDTISIRVIRDAKNEDRQAKEEVIRSFQPVLFYMAECHLLSIELIRESVLKTLKDLLDLLEGLEDLSAFEEKAMSLAVRNFLNAALKEDYFHLSFAAKGSDPREIYAVYTPEDEFPRKNTQFTEKESMNILKHLLKRLPDDQRMIFAMHYLDRIPFARISSMIHVDEEILKKRAQLAKNCLSDMIGKPICDLFGIVELAEENKHLVLRDEITPEPEIDPVEIREEPVREPEEDITPQGKKPAFKTVQKTEADEKKEPSVREKNVFRKPALAFGVVCAAGLLAGFTVFRKPVEVSLLPLVQPVFSGVDGNGSASLVLVNSDNEKVNSVIDSASCVLLDENGNEVKPENLRNGERLTLSCSFNEKALKKARITPAETETSVRVSGLSEPEDVDLFDGVVLDTETDEETGEMKRILTFEKPVIDGVTYSIVSEEDDAVKVRAEISDDELLDMGYRTDTHEKTYTGEEVPALSEAMEYTRMIEQGLLSIAPYHAEDGSEVANGSDPAMNELAQSYLGRVGACNVIARQFILDLYGVDINGRGNTYAVDTPEAGDLVNYYDANGNFTHVATYIGNGLVLNGNYNGTTHITSIYDSFYAQNPMVYLRVVR